LMHVASGSCQRVAVEAAHQNSLCLYDSSRRLPTSRSEGASTRWAT
jgi:hypothetical protein